MSSNKISEIAESLYAFTHSEMTNTIDFIDKACGDIFEKHQSFDKQTRNRIGLEYMALFLHVTSLAAITILGEDKAFELWERQESIFIDHMMSSRKNINKDDREDLELSLRIFFEKRNLEYAKYKAFPEKDEGLRGNLFFEFAIHVSEAAGYPMDIRVVVLAFGGAMAFTRGVNWKETLGQAI